MRPLIALVLFVFLFASCRKDSIREIPSQPQSAINDFVAPDSLPAQILKVSDFILQEDSKHHFLAKFRNNCGTPVWDKSILMPAPKIVVNSSGQGSGLPEDVVLVPLAKDSLVKAFMACVVSGDSVRIKVYRDNRYGLWGYAPQQGIKNAEYISLQFMLLNQEVFGFNKFKITDSLLFSGIPEQAFTKYITLKNPETVSESYSISYEVCRQVVHDGDEGQVVGVAPGESNDYSYVQTVCFIRTIWIETADGGGGSGSGGPSGGGGSGDGGGGTGSEPGGGGDPWWDDDCDPNAPTTVKGDPCSQEDPGWEPVIEPDYVVNLDANISAIEQMIGLNKGQKSWLRLNPEQAELFLDFLLETGDTEFSVAAVKTTLDLQITNQLYIPYGTAKHNIFKNYCPMLSDNQNIDLLGRLITVHAAILRLQHPDWSDARIYLVATWEATSEAVHLILDIGGMVPVVGEVCDITNGVIYSLEGDGVNATLSYSSAIPVAGWFSTGAKFAKRTINIVGGGQQTVNYVVSSAGFISFGDRGLLRKILGLLKGDLRQAHHIIPWKMANDPIVQKAAQKNFHLNDLANGIPLSPVQHADGGHAAYIQRIRDEVATYLVNKGGIQNVSPDEAASFLSSVIARIKTAVTANPNTKLNDIIF